MTEFSPGLEGMVAAQTAISEVDGANGRLIYRGGYLIEDLAPVVSFEEVAYLLWQGELPSKTQLDALCKQMAAGRNLNSAAHGALMATDPTTDPMDVLRTVVSAQGATKTLVKPTLEEAIALTAVFPTIVAAAYRRRQGQAIVAPRPDLPHTANLLWMMEGKDPPAERVHWVESYLLMLADHGLNASTFAARVVASTGSDLTSSVVGAIGALKDLLTAAPRSLRGRCWTRSGQRRTPRSGCGMPTPATNAIQDSVTVSTGPTTREPRFSVRWPGPPHLTCTAPRRAPKSWRFRSCTRHTQNGPMRPTSISGPRSC